MQTQRVLVTQQAYNPELDRWDPLFTHSEYACVTSVTMVGTNVLRMEHTNGEVSMVVLGEGYTVSCSVDDK